jgi:hypothetical protein
MASFDRLSYEQFDEVRIIVYKDSGKYYTNERYYDQYNTHDAADTPGGIIIQHKKADGYEKKEKSVG